MIIKKYKEYVNENLFKFKSMNYGRPDAKDVGKAHFGEMGTDHSVNNNKRKGVNTVENRMVYSQSVGKYYTIDDFNSIVRKFFLKYGHDERIDTTPSTENLDYMLAKLDE